MSHKPMSEEARERCRQRAESLSRAWSPAIQELWNAYTAANQEAHERYVTFKTALDDAQENPHKERTDG